jgi:hypothetical protein
MNWSNIAVIPRIDGSKKVCLENYRKANYSHVYTCIDETSRADFVSSRIRIIRRHQGETVPPSSLLVGIIMISGSQIFPLREIYCALPNPVTDSPEWDGAYRSPREVIHIVVGIYFTR